MDVRAVARVRCADDGRPIGRRDATVERADLGRGAAAAEVCCRDAISDARPAATWHELLAEVEQPGVARRLGTMQDAVTVAFEVLDDNLNDEAVGGLVVRPAQAAGGAEEQQFQVRWREWQRRCKVLHGRGRGDDLRVALAIFVGTAGEGVLEREGLGRQRIGRREQRHAGCRRADKRVDAARGRARFELSRWARRIADDDS
jgi:hypothetical protein